MNSEGGFINILGLLYYIGKVLGISANLVLIIFVLILAFLFLYSAIFATKKLKSLPKEKLEKRSLMQLDVSGGVVLFFLWSGAVVLIYLLLMTIMDILK